LDEGFIKFKQLAQEVKETLHQGELKIANNEETSQSRDNKNKTIVTNVPISEEQKNENILKKNEEKHFLKTAAKEMISKIENNKKMLKESISLKELETNDTIKLSKEEKSSAKKMKKKFAKKQKPMLDTIEQILYESIRSLNEKTSLTFQSTFSEIITQRKKSEYKSLVSMFLQDLVDQEDPQLILDIKSFLENKHILNKDTNYQYEFMLMHLGAMTYNKDMLMNLKPLISSDSFSNLEEDSKNELVRVTPELINRYKKHEKIVDDMLESMEDEKTKIKIQCFKNKISLYNLPQYKYEGFIRTIGIILYGCGDHLKEV